MKIVSFSVEKYRSITKAHKIRLERTAILIGPNNEGKSNILRALVAAMKILTRGRQRVVYRSSPHTRFIDHRFYDWHTDFPVHLQKRIPKENL